MYICVIVMDLYTCLQNIYIYWCNCRNAILRFFNLQVTEKASSGHGWLCDLNMAAPWGDLLHVKWNNF